MSLLGNFVRLLKSCLLSRPRKQAPTRRTQQLYIGHRRAQRYQGSNREKSTKGKLATSSCAETIVRTLR